MSRFCNWNDVDASATSSEAIPAMLQKMYPGRSSLTAELVCLIRAIDYHRCPEQRIVDDPYAATLLSPALREQLAAIAATEVVTRRALCDITTYVLARHRVIDDALRRALAADEIDQVVVLGAGYDTRAQRFFQELDDTPVIEVDVATTQALKRTRLDSGSISSKRVQHLAVDFRTDSLREALGPHCDKTDRLFVIWEGVSMYLEPNAIARTLEDLRAICVAGSILCVDWFHYPLRRPFFSGIQRIAVSGLSLLGEPIRCTLGPDSVITLLRRHGFDVSTLADSKALAGMINRPEVRIYPGCFYTQARAIDSRAAT